jgi:hypothetical protein
MLSTVYLGVRFPNQSASITNTKRYEITEFEFSFGRLDSLCLNSKGFSAKSLWARYPYEFCRVTFLSQYLRHRHRQGGTSYADKDGKTTVRKIDLIPNTGAGSS